MTDHFGYVALCGRPNVGKSTLLNHILRQKISITSRRPQTTRYNVLGVDTHGNHQAVYIDTPGIHAKTGKALNRYMVEHAKSALRDVDLSLMVVEATRWTEEDEAVLKLIQGRGEAVAAITKIDLLQDKTELLPVMERLGQTGVFAEIVPVCALRDEGIEDLRRVVFSALPEGGHHFDADEVTDQTERRIVAEIIREKLMRQLGDEIPHSATVTVERFAADQKQDGSPLTEIHANIYVERPSQKKIVIGRNGKRLKLIGELARADIEVLLDQQVMLHLWVKVRKGWTDDEQLMRRLGYD